MEVGATGAEEGSAAAVKPTGAEVGPGVGVGASSYGDSLSLYCAEASTIVAAAFLAAAREGVGPRGVRPVVLTFFEGV